MAHYHVVFTLPAAIADIAYANKAVVYDALFKAASQTVLAIAADRKHLGARIGVTMVLHTWGSALTHHPHVHCVVPGGGLSLDGDRWVSCRPGFFLPVRVLSRLFRRLMLERLAAAHAAGALLFFGAHEALQDADAFEAFLRPLRRVEWVVYAKRPFAGPDQVLSYLALHASRGDFQQPAHFVRRRASGCVADYGEDLLLEVRSLSVRQWKAVSHPTQMSLLWIKRQSRDCAIAAVAIDLYQ